MKKIILLIAFVASSILSAEAQLVNDSTLATGNEESLITKVENWYANHMNYATITILMAIESSFIPFPSEIVIPPAAYVAEDPNSDLHVTESYPVNVLLIVLFGTLGAMLGAIINYLLAMWLGRPIIYAFDTIGYCYTC